VTGLGEGEGRLSELEVESGLGMKAYFPLASVGVSASAEKAARGALL